MNDRVETLCICQAGENRVYMATIETRGGASASRGAAAVMGDKKLKAIAVCGTKDVFVANPSKFYEACDRVIKRSQGLIDFVDQATYSSTEFLFHRFFYFDGLKVDEGEFNWPVMPTDFNKEYQSRR